MADCKHIRVPGARSFISAMCFAGLWLWGSSPVDEKHPPASQARKQPDSVQFQMKNVNFLLAPDIALEVKTLRGQLQSSKADVPVTFDDPASFVVNIDTAEVAVTPESLTTLMNSYVFAYPGAPVKDVTMTIKGNHLIQKGTIHKKVDLPFEIEGSISATTDGNIRVHADKIKSKGIPVKGLLHFLGEDLAKLVKQSAGRGVQVEGDDLILNLRALTPPPHMIGKVSRASIDGGKVVQHFDSGRHLAPLKPPFPAGAYIYHRGGVVRFGKLTMQDADLEIVGDRPGAFNFFQREYLKQLVAGYSKSTANKGLVAHMIDYSRVGSTRTSADRKAPVPAASAPH